VFTSALKPAKQASGKQNHVERQNLKELKLSQKRRKLMESAVQVANDVM
jgi:hypothetical protein